MSSDRTSMYDKREVFCGAKKTFKSVSSRGFAPHRAAGSSRRSSRQPSRLGSFIDDKMLPAGAFCLRRLEPQPRPILPQLCLLDPSLDTNPFYNRHTYTMSVTINHIASHHITSIAYGLSIGTNLDDIE